MARGLAGGCVRAGLPLQCRPVSEVLRHQFDNGLTLLVEPMAGVASVGVKMLLPAGAAREPAEKLGVGSVLSEMLFRGAGDRDARAHSEALDQLGVKRSSDVQTYHMTLGMTVLGDRLASALPLMTDMVRRPTLGDEAFGPARELAIQGIDALEDEPQQKAMIELKRAHLAPPLNRPTLGERAHLSSLTADEVRAYAGARFAPAGSVLALAGRVDYEAVCEQVERLLGDWSGGASEVVSTGASSAGSAGGYRHVEAESAQQHIGVAYPAPAESDEASMLQRVAVAVLSAGMSGRLFTEVRERRGLCYAVSASYRSLLDRGAVFAYAGTTSERAAETLEVLTAELRRLSDGVERDEFDRAVVGLKTRLVMMGESTGARASALAGDEFLLGGPRTLEEVADEIDAVTLDRLNEFVASRRPEEMTIVNIGPAPLR